MAEEFGVEISRTLLWIVLFPLWGAILNGLLCRSASRRCVGGLAVGSVAVSFLLSLVAFGAMPARHGGGSDGAAPSIAYKVYEWFSISLGGDNGASLTRIPVSVAFVMDPLSGVMALVVTGIGLLIHIYSLGYMHDEPS